MLDMVCLQIGKVENSVEISLLILLFYQFCKKFLEFGNGTPTEELWTKQSLLLCLYTQKYISFVGVTRKTIVMRLHDMSLWKQMSTQMMFCASCSLENAICYFTSNCLFVLIQLELLVSIFFFIWKSDTFLFLALL